MLHHSLQGNARNSVQPGVLECKDNVSSAGPSVKTMNFLSASKANDAVKRLKSECEAEMRNIVPTQMEDAQDGP